MKGLHWIQVHILDTLPDDGGGMHLKELFASKPDVKIPTRDYHVRQLFTRGDIERVQNGIYKKPTPTDPETQFRQTRKKFSEDARSAEDNQQTINALLNTYDEVLALFQTWVLTNIISQEIDFAQQLLFIDNFKWLTTIVDKLMKRWSLVHLGYDSNSRQAQEDAKAKTEERQKKALEDAPLEETLHVVGHYHTDLKKLWDQPLDPEQEALPEPEQAALPEPEQEKRNI